MHSTLVAKAQEIDRAKYVGTALTAWALSCIDAIVRPISQYQIVLGIFIFIDEVKQSHYRR
jgi:hypothetical protein